MEGKFVDADADPVWSRIAVSTSGLTASRRRSTTMQVAGTPASLTGARVVVHDYCASG